MCRGSSQTLKAIRLNGTVLCIEIGNSLLERAEIGPLRFYDLRHTFYDACPGFRVPVKVLQERLGHASATMTLDEYAKVEPSPRANAAKQMSGITGDWCALSCARAGGGAENV